MTECGYLFTTALHEKLKDKIVGKVFVRVTKDDGLYIKIENGDLKYKMFIEDFSTKILNGYSSDYAAYEIVKSYRKFVMNNYFI